jgi:hypothetical protein
VHKPILDAGRQTGLLEVIGEDCVFPTVDAAVRHIDAETGSATRNAGGRQDD